MLARDFNCELQIGGSDQWGNITAGIDLCRKKAAKTVLGLTLPLITKADGTKFGKTEGGAIWLDPKNTSVYKFYQFWINTDERDVIRYLKFFTMPKDANDILAARGRINKLEEKHKTSPDAREAHRALASGMTELIHGPEAAGNALIASEVLFGGTIDPQSSWDLILGEVPTKEIEITKFGGTGMPLFELLVHSGLCSSKGEARQKIEEGGIYVKNVREINYQRAITTNDLHSDKYILLRKGKKNYAVVMAK